jgi:hypothetical protein
VDQDDSGGYQCNLGKFPLLTKIYNELANVTNECPTTTKSSTTLPPDQVSTRKKFITPVWKKTTRPNLKDSKIGSHNTKPSSINSFIFPGLNFFTSSSGAKLLSNFFYSFLNSFFIFIFIFGRS